MADKKITMHEAFLKTFTQSLIQHSFVGPIHPQPIAQPQPQVPHGYTPSMIQPQPPQLKRTPMPKFAPPMHMPQRMPNTPHEEIHLGRLTQFLNDPSVISIECPGPGRNLFVNRSGTIQTLPLVLDKQEIENIMDEVSDRTRIPITQGLFRAVMQDFLVTAVVSEFVGTRFIIQKRIPGLV